MTIPNHPEIRRLAARIDLHLPTAASGLLATRRGIVRVDAIPHLLAVNASAWAGWATNLLRREASYADALGQDMLANSLYEFADATIAATAPENRHQRLPVLAPGLALRQLAPLNGTQPWHLPSIGSHLAETPPEFPRRERAQFLLIADEELAALLVTRPLRPLGLFAPPWLRFRTADAAAIERASAFIGRHGLRFWTQSGGPL